MQFFLAHQDSEKDDSMIGTLVVTLPSGYTGGELMVGHNEEWKAYRGSKTALSLVAFYADCRHEVLRVESGYRITLTYNLLLHGDTSRPEGDGGTVAELADLLSEHFSTPVPRYYSGPATDPPNRLVYLLDHQYTPRGLNWRRLKGADASRVALLRTAADKAGCEAVLALADIKTTHSAFPADEGYGYRGWYDDYGEDDDEYSDGAGDSERDYDIQDLVDSEVTLTHWTGPEGTRLEETSLFVNGDEVCASTQTGDLEPYSSEYEGYMGNWGNTLDRWYHRAAVIVWPRDQAFANRAETSPAWALDELAAMASAGDVSGARAAAATLESFWDGALRTRTPEERGTVPGLFGKALLAADAVADAEAAAMLLRPFWRCPRCAPRQSCPGTARAATLASATWPPTARRGSAPGSPARSARPATGRSPCPRAAAHATCATPSACSPKTRAGVPSSGRSPSSAGSTSTPGSTPPNCPSPT